MATHVDRTVELVSGSEEELGTATNPINQRLKQFRTNLPIHRSAVTAADKLAVPAVSTAADVATGGSLVFATTYNFTMAAGNQFGVTTAPGVVAQLTANDAASTH